MKNKLAGIVILAGCFFILSCGSKRESLTVAGSSTVLPLVTKAAEQFQLKNNINIIVNAGGSGVGVNQLGGGKVQIGMISRDLTVTEIKEYPKVKFKIHEIGKDAVVPVVSSEIYDTGIKALTLEQIGHIYLGKIKNWKELGGPDKKILVIDKEASRGTRHVFMKIVLGDKNAKAPGADQVSGSNNEEQTDLIQSDAAIGMLSYAWLNKDVKGLGIKMEDQVIEPSLENIINGSFPITRSLVLITNGTPTGNTKKFIEFILSADGQKIIEESGYVSITK